MVNERVVALWEVLNDVGSVTRVTGGLRYPSKILTWNLYNKEVARRLLYSLRLLLACNVYNMCNLIIPSMYLNGCT